MKKSLISILLFACGNILSQAKEYSVFSSELSILDRKHNMYDFVESYSRDFKISINYTNKTFTFIGDPLHFLSSDEMKIYTINRIDNENGNSVLYIERYSDEIKVVFPFSNVNQFILYRVFNEGFYEYKNTIYYH